MTTEVISSRHLPRTLTTLDARTQDAYDKHHRNLFHLQEIKSHYIALGVSLIDTEESKAWSRLGFDDFDSYCYAPIGSNGLGLTDNYKQMCMRVANRYHFELGVPIDRLMQIGPSNLQIAVSVVNVANRDQVLSDAETLSARDLRKNKAEGVYSGVPQRIEPDEEKTGTSTFPNPNILNRDQIIQAIRDLFSDMGRKPEHIKRDLQIIQNECSILLSNLQENS